jgi:diguanylate cyclase (GGDEF)-like protein
MIPRRHDKKAFRRTLLLTIVSVIASAATTLLLIFLLFGADPGATITVGRAAIVMLSASTICSSLLCFSMSHSSSLTLKRLAQVQAELWEISRTDELTGLLNRRGFVEAADVALAEAKQKQIPAVALMCDIDRFKSLNDSFGHDFGDAALVKLGNLLRAQSEITEMIVGRHGGEEFVALMLGKTAAEAMQTAEAIRQACAAQTVCHDGTSAQITISIGLAPSEHEPSLELLLRDADKALYQAKDAGRDRVMLAAGSSHSIAA